MKLSAKERQRYAHILPLLEQNEPKEEDEIVEKEIVVELNKGWMIIVAIIILICGFYGFIALFKAFFIGLIFLAIAIWSGRWLWKKWTNPIMAIIDEEGVYIGRKETTFPWDDIDHLSFVNQTVAFGGKNSNSSSEQWFWCVLKNGDKFYARIDSTNYTLKTLSQKVAKVFPKVKCKTNGEV